ncbi:MAG: hypothetical protein NTY53_23610 [Kiritimatiellaeota bacterium]|nr:hypothetical protein [Kiritimatiellota bacterium]
MYEPDDRLFIGSRYNTGPEHVRSAAEWAAEFARGGAVPEHIVPNPLTGEAALKKDGGRSYRADACVAKFRFAVVEFDTTPAPLRTPAQQEAAAKILGRQYVPDELEGLQRKLVWPRCEQLRFWLGAVSYGWPIAALIDSGGKSVHGWLRVDAKDAADWDETVERGLFGMLKPLGVDASCKNECRLSRMPGHFRIEKGNWQRLLYLDPTKGGTSCR